LIVLIDSLIEEVLIVKVSTFLFFYEVGFKRKTNSSSDEKTPELKIIA